jgi:hypothetical protein
MPSFAAANASRRGALESPPDPPPRLAAASNAAAASRASFPLKTSTSVRWSPRPATTCAFAGSFTPKYASIACEKSTPRSSSLPPTASGLNVGMELKGVRSGVERRQKRCIGIEREGPWAERCAGRESP